MAWQADNLSKPRIFLQRIRSSTWLEAKSTTIATLSKASNPRQQTWKLTIPATSNYSSHFINTTQHFFASKATITTGHT
jgi:hypothetical protein